MNCEALPGSGVPIVLSVKVMQLCGLFPFLQNHTYNADIMLDAYAHLRSYYAKNYAGIIDSGIVSINLAMLNNYSE